MRPLIVGLHNPLSPHPADALVPYPSGCAGWRLWMMMRDVVPRFSRDTYLHGFDRRNLWRGRELPSGKGSTAAYRSEGDLVLSACHGRTDVVLLGARVWDSVAMCLAPSWFECKEVLPGIRFWRIPHPSGRNFIYQSMANRRRAGLLLVDLLSPGGIDP